MAIKDPVEGDITEGNQGVQNRPVVTPIQTPMGWTLTWGRLGVFVGPYAPPNPVVYEAWEHGAPGYWGWIQT
jgi:hypothetical protein